MVSRSSLVVALTGLALNAIAAGPAYHDPVHEVVGPLYTASDILKFEVNGVHLGMSKRTSAALLIQQGFSQRVRDESYFRDSDASTFDDHMSIDYWKRNGRGVPKSSSVSLWMHARVAHEQDRLQWREKFLKQFGSPSFWRKPTNYSSVPEMMLWVSQAHLRDDMELQKVWSCTASWQCDRVLSGTDCRPILRQARSPVLKIAFLREVITIELDDYEARHDEIKRDPNFDRMSTRGVTCLLPRVH